MKKTCKADLSSIRKILDEVGIAEYNGSVVKTKI